MHTTHLRPSHTIRPFPTFTRPVIEGYFSLDRERNYHDSMCNLKYLKIPSKVNFDLNQGDRDYVEKPSSADNEQISHLLTFIMKNKSNVMTKRGVPDFVCFRGLLRMIMSTPYDEREAWIVLATKVKGTIYLCSEKTQQKKADKLRQTERDIKFIRYGFKFERHILSDHPSKPAPGSNEPVIEPEEFCIMFTAEIAGKRVLYGAETDGVIAKEPCKTLEDLQRVPKVEVKVKRRETNQRQLENFYKLKSRNWWLQSFLVGIDSIHVGIRNDGGIVEDVQRMKIKELSDVAKLNNYWHGTVAMNFLNDFLKKISNDMKAIDNPYVVYRYTWDPSRSDYVAHHVFEGHQHCFLTPEYIRAMDN